MPIPDPGFVLIDLPPIPPEVLESYHHVELDPYMGNQTRYKRFSQYKMTFDERDGWGFELLPPRAYTAFKQFNPVAGGIRRHYQPISVDFTPVVKVVSDGPLPLDDDEDWQINVHQNRSRAFADKPGQLTPEGVHQDGHEYVMIAVLARHNVKGGEMRLWRPNQDEPFWRGTLRPGQAALLDDRAILHDVTDLQPDGEDAYRDILIVSFSRWQEKWYGEEHDSAVLAGGAETPA